MTHNYKDLKIPETELDILLKRIAGITDSKYEINYLKSLKGNGETDNIRLSDATGFFSRDEAIVSIKFISVADKEQDYFGELTIESRNSSEDYESEIKSAIEIYFGDKKRR